MLRPGWVVLVGVQKGGAGDNCDMEHQLSVNRPLSSFYMSYYLEHIS